MKEDRIQEYNQNLNASIALQPIIKYEGVNIWLMCLQDSEINLMESKMVGISTMIGGYVPEVFWSLVPNEAVNDNLPSKNFESLIKFYLDMKEGNRNPSTNCPLFRMACRPYQPLRIGNGGLC